MKHRETTSNCSFASIQTQTFRNGFQTFGQACKLCSDVMRQNITMVIPRISLRQDQTSGHRRIVKLTLIIGLRVNCGCSVTYVNLRRNVSMSINRIPCGTWDVAQGLKMIMAQDSANTHGTHFTCLEAQRFEDAYARADTCEICTWTRAFYTDAHHSKKDICDI